MGYQEKTDAHLKKIVEEEQKSHRRKTMPQNSLPTGSNVSRKTSSSKQVVEQIASQKSLTNSVYSKQTKHSKNKSAGSKNKNT